MKRNSSELTDSELVKLAKSESRYFGVLYERYFDPIFRFVFKRVGGDEDLAGDLTQYTFIKAMANIVKYEDRGLPFCSWLYRIAQNEVSMHFRKAKKNYTVSVDENRIKDVAQEACINSYMSEEDQNKLIELINNLDESQMELIELRFFQEMSFKDIAEIYNITEANAKMRTYRILEKLGKNWGPKK